MEKLVVLSILAVFAIGSAIGLECPVVESLRCLTRQPVDEDCRMQTTIKLEDGTECPGCQLCIRKEEQAGSLCPPMPCPMWQLEPSCKPTFWSQHFTMNTGEECSACDTFLCED